MTSAMKCPACGSSVASGRLSCPACGAILAAVRGGPRDVSLTGAGRSSGPASSATGPPTEATAGQGPSPASDLAGSSAPPPPRVDRALGLGPPPIRRDWAGPEPSSALAESVPGSYLPPSAISSSPRAEPSPSASLGRGETQASGVPVTPGGTPGSSSMGRPSALTLRALGEPTASWLVVAGSALGLVAFLLPWSPNGVIGSPGDGGYLGRWGLANGAYIVVMAAAFGCLAVQLLETRLPAAVRDGVLPLALGGFLLGLAWTYVAGPFGADLGVQATIVGGLLLVLGGGLGVRTAASRSAGPPTS